MTFLPKGYKLPESNMGGGYMKLVQGANKFRILSDAVTGFELWTDENKPVRYREYPESVPGNMRVDSRVKSFWAFVVWNYAAQAVQILQLTQSTIMGAINDLVINSDWGEPTNYDITIARRGEGLETEYTVQPSPHKEVAANIAAAYKSKNINLDALFDGGNPFEEEGDINFDEKDVPFPDPPKSVRR